MAMLPPFTRRFRRHHNRQLPSYYAWQGHILINASMLILAFALTFREASLLLTLAWLPVWGVIEYFLHRFALHQWLKLKLARHHSIFHHLYFTEAEMHASEGIDTNRVLLLPLDLLSLLVATFLGALLLQLTHSTQLAASFALAAVIYVTLYETIHGLSHLKSAPRFLRHWVLHHQAHHNTKRMHAVNFSVVIPWLDELMGTKEKH